MNAPIEASPLLVESRGEPFVLVASSDGTITAVEPLTGAAAWSLRPPASSERRPFLAATPAWVGGSLVVSYQEGQTHRVAVIDLERRAYDDDYPVLELAAEKQAADASGVVSFNSLTALSRAAVAHARTDETEMGYVYVSFGGLMDIQPWHGWVFEIDLDAWKAKGAKAAVSGVLLTTPETDCGEPGASGSYHMLCGAGVWAPAGPQVYWTEGGFELLVPTGNGQLDLTRKDYANTLMRLRRGLEFDPACDEQLCADFDPIRPAEECMESCRNLFIPRLMPGDSPLRPASGACDEKTFIECSAALDYDLGANAPVKVDLPGGPSVYVQPGKDGSLYLIDSTSMGVLYDREQVVEICGAPGDDCSENRWRGMMVTQPAVTRVGADPVVIVPTFNFDKTHPAGLVALKIVLKENTPRFEPFWRAPDSSTAEAVKRFRYYPSRVVISSFQQEAYAWVVDVGESPTARGTILGVRVRDGMIVRRVELAGRGTRHVRPLMHDNVLYVPSTWMSNGGPAHGLEMYQVSLANQ